MINTSVETISVSANLKDRHTMFKKLKELLQRVMIGIEKSGMARAHASLRRHGYKGSLQ
jgi:hypothetical protein